MKKKTGIWRFAGPLRVAALLTAAIHVFYYLYIWTLAWLGDTEEVFDFVDIISTAPLKPMQIVGSMTLSGVFIGSVLMIALTTNSFLKGASRNGFFDARVAKTLKHLGYGLLLFWLGLSISDSLMPWLMTLNFDPELRESIEWFPLDSDIIALIVGFVLILLSGAMDEAREIDDENKQII